jgi:hypothetical protein
MVTSSGRDRQVLAAVAEAAVALRKAGLAAS